MPICTTTNTSFEISELEKNLRKEFDVPDPTMLPHLRLRHLGAFWPHWSLHSRMCNATQKSLISIYRPECPYPVWDRDVWFD